MPGMPTHLLWFLVAWWGLLAIGIGGARFLVVERLRLNAGGVEPVSLRRGKRVVDTLVVLLLAISAFWFVLAVVRVLGGV